MKKNLSRILAVLMILVSSYSLTADWKPKHHSTSHTTSPKRVVNRARHIAHRATCSIANASSMASEGLMMYYDNKKSCEKSPISGGDCVKCTSDTSDTSCSPVANTAACWTPKSESQLTN